MFFFQRTTDVYGNERSGQFSFEVKGIFDEGVFHGSANYGLFLDGESHYKMRSYSQKPRRMVTSQDDELIFENDVQIVHDFLNSLKEPASVRRSNVYVKVSILKLGDYKNKAISYIDSRLLPGYTMCTARLLREFSLSQFTFRDYEQYKSWKSEFNQLRNKYQQSYEMFFLHKNGLLNYQKMVDDINNVVLSGDLKYKTHDRFPNDHANRILIEHESAGTLDTIKTKLKNMYNLK